MHFGTNKSWTPAMIQRAREELQDAGANVSEAARALGIKCRAKLYSLIRCGAPGVEPLSYSMGQWKFEARRRKRETEDALKREKQALKQVKKAERDFIRLQGALGAIQK